jgi:adenine-specific DNA methylase
VVASLALAVDRLVDRTCCLARWRPQADQEKVESVFGRQALGMTWDFAEGVPLSAATASWEDAVGHPLRVIEELSKWSNRPAHVERATATKHPLPDDSADAFVTDPPYYDAVPYAHLSDFFYVWLKRSLRGVHGDLFRDDVVDKADEIVVDRPHHLSTSTKDIAFYETALRKAFAEGRRVLRPTGVGVVVFASKTTASWEAILDAVIGAGWVITGSWPIDTEMEARIAARGQARLASSVHLVCRPREHVDGTLRSDEVGDWRAIPETSPHITPKAVRKIS